MCSGSSCVECAGDRTDACDADNPYCDFENNECVECTEHTHCPESACDRARGRCLDPRNVVEVGPESCSSTIECGSSPLFSCCTLEDAFALDAQELTIRLIDPEVEVSAPFVIDGRRIAILGSESLAEVPDLSASFSKDPFRFILGTADSALYLERVRIQPLDADLFAIEAGRVDLSRVRLDTYRRMALLSDETSVLVMRNSISEGIGSFAGETISADAGEVDIVFSTLTRSDGALLDCEPGASVAVRNSFLIAETDDATLIGCPGVDVSYSATTTELAGAGNQSVGAPQVWWFDGDWQGLSGEHPELLHYIARWSFGDPGIDFFGNPRMVGDGAMGTAGAEVLGR